jgi:phosphoribosylformylglycinamidine synthase subunit PurL
LNAILGKADGTAPLFDMQKELQVQGVLDGLIQQGLINAAHGCGRGGVYAALLALSLNSDLGFDIVTDSEIREDAFLFGESPNRAIVTVSEDQEGDFIEFMMNSALPFTLLGHVTKGKLMVDEEHYGFVHEVAEVLARKNN